MGFDKSDAQVAATETNWSDSEILQFEIWVIQDKAYIYKAILNQPFQPTACIFRIIIECERNEALFFPGRLKVRIYRRYLSLETAIASKVADGDKLSYICPQSFRCTEE